MLDTIFHYASSAAAIGIIKYQQIWASKIQYLNDENEYLQYISHFEKVARKRFNSSDKVESSFLDDLIGTLKTILSANIFVASFSERGDLLSQWRGYCPSGGYSLGMPLEKIENSLKEEGIYFCKAIYSAPNDDDIALVIERSFRDYVAQYTPIKTSPTKCFESLIDHILKEAPRYKHSGFEEESEWRAYSPLIKIGDERLDVVEIRGRLRPILKIGLSKEHKAANENLGLQFTTSYTSPGPDAELRRSALSILMRQNNRKYKMIKESSIPYNPR